MKGPGTQVSGPFLILGVCIRFRPGIAIRLWACAVVGLSGLLFGGMSDGAGRDKEEKRCTSATIQMCISSF